MKLDRSQQFLAGYVSLVALSLFVGMCMGPAEFSEATPAEPRAEPHAPSETEAAPAPSTPKPAPTKPSVVLGSDPVLTELSGSYEEALSGVLSDLGADWKKLPLTKSRVKALGAVLDADQVARLQKMTLLGNASRPEEMVGVVQLANPGEGEPPQLLTIRL